MGMKTKTWRQNKLLILFSLLAAIIIVDACRKIDYKRDGQGITHIDPTEKFFTIPANTDPLIKVIANLIKRQNETAHFANDLSKKIGFPIWNKAKLASSPKHTTLSNLDSNDMTYSYIPFGLDSTIKAFLIVRTTPQDTLMRLINDWEYSLAGFNNPNASVWDARDVFHMFARFEKDVYGHSSFNLLDRRLCVVGDTTLPVIATIKGSAQSNAGGNSLLVAVTLCDYVDYCYAPPNQALCNGGVCTTDCDQYLYTGTECSTFWVEDGWGGGSPPYIPWSGGGGGGPWFQNTCTAAGAYCSNVGWSQVTTNDFIANYPSQGYNHFLNMPVIKADKDAINYWKLNNIDTTGLDPCIRGIFDKLLEDTSVLGRILVKMDRANFRSTSIKDFKLKYMVDTIPNDPNALAHTSAGVWNPTTQVFTDTIRIRPGVADTATDIAITQLIMHETVHAYLKLIFHKYWHGQFSSTQIDTMGISGMFDIFIDSMIAQHTYEGLQNWWSGNPDRDHNFMADKMLSIFASILEKVNGSLIGNKRYYWFTTWIGLKESSTMAQFWPNYPNWPPSNPAPNDDSTYGLRYALTLSRIDSIWEANTNEVWDTANALGKRRFNPGCYVGY